MVENIHEKHYSRNEKKKIIFNYSVVPHVTTLYICMIVATIVFIDFSECVECADSWSTIRRFFVSELKYVFQDKCCKRKNEKKLDGNVATKCKYVTAYTQRFDEKENVEVELLDILCFVFFSVSLPNSSIEKYRENICITCDSHW